MTMDAPPRDNPVSLRKRRMTIRTNVLAQLLALVAVAVMVNWLAARHYRRFDWTRSHYYRLSEKTKQALTSLKSPVDVVVFVPTSGSYDALQKVLEDVRNLLKEFQDVGRQNLRVEYVDPDRDKAHAERLVEKYQLDPRSPDVVIFACGDRHKYLRLDELVEMEGDGRRTPARIRAFKGEGMFLSALQSIIEGEPPKVYFLTGHGERDPEDFDERRGYSTLSRYIQRDNLTVHKWNLSEKREMPSDAGVIVIAGPRQPFTTAEAMAVEEYIGKRNRMMILLDPRQDSGLKPMLQRLGVKVDQDLVLARGRLLGADVLLADVTGTQYAQHPVVAKLTGINTTFSYARSIRRLETKLEPGADRPQVTELVKSPEMFWGETDAASDHPSFDAGSDLRGPLSLAVAVEVGQPVAAGLAIGSARVVVVGTSGFVDNKGLTGGNLDFFMSALNWLLRREMLVAVGPKTPEEFRVDLSPSQAQMVSLLVIVGLPLFVALTGMVVWLRRRR